VRRMRDKIFNLMMKEMNLSLWAAAALEPLEN
jgi:hypothetical protein